MNSRRAGQEGRKSFPASPSPAPPRRSPSASPSCGSQPRKARSQPRAEGNCALL